MKLITAKNREKVLREEIERMIDIIISRYDPERIILFGSLANGTVHEWSDIDLLIIKKTNKRPIERCLEVCRLIKPKVGVDLFIYTPEEHEAFLKERFSFLLHILSNGKILYEKRG